MVKIDAPANSIIIYSAEAGETAQDGVFTPILVNFIREQKEMPIPSPKVLSEMTQGYRREVEAFAESEGLKIYTFGQKDDKGEIAKQHLAEFEKKSGVVLIGKAQEKTSPLLWSTAAPSPRI